MASYQGGYQHGGAQSNYQQQQQQQQQYFQGNNYGQYPQGNNYEQQQQQNPQQYQQQDYNSNNNNNNYQYQNQNQNYQPPPPQPPPTQGFDGVHDNGNGNGMGNYGEKPPSFDQAFKLEKPKYNDLWAGILFILTMGGFVAVSAISLKGYASSGSSTGSSIYNSSSTSVTLNSNTLYLFLFCLGAAIVLSYAYVLLARTFPRQLIWITGILNIVFGFVTAIYMLVTKNYVGGILFLIFAVFLVVAFISWIPRIPFSALMLRTAIDVAKKHGHVYLVSFVGGMVGAVFAAWFACTLTAIYVRFSPGSAAAGGSGSNAKVGGLVAFVTFASYWFSEWLKNTIHTIVSGIYGSWYFNSKAYPTGVTRGAMKRSLTYSFGSISLGSLVVAVINFLRMLANVGQQSEAAQGNTLASILFCVLGCLISILQWAVEFVNRYAFSHIALYGKPYFEAAKDTWTMIKTRGIDALVNECLIGPVFSFGATFVGYACALLAYLYLRYTNPSYNSGGDFTTVVTAFAFLIGLQICNIFTTPLSSGIDTIFVAAAWDPEVMIRDHPDLYQQMVAVYPQVQQAIHA